MCKYTFLYLVYVLCIVGVSISAEKIPQEKHSDLIKSNIKSINELNIENKNHKKSPKRGEKLTTFKTEEIRKDHKNKKELNLHKNRVSGSKNQTISSYSKWSSWSRCVDCIERRMKKCIAPHCFDSRLYEERTCNKKRCKRKLKRKQDFRLVHLNKDSNFLLKQGPFDHWSKWHSWTSCSRSCKTSRIRFCKKPGRCKKQKQIQNAFCYHHGSNCENYVLELLNKNDKIPNDNRRYEYGVNETHVAKKYKKMCGMQNRKARMLKIIGGSESQKYKWPWHVAVLNRYREVFCGGTLVSPRWVLTASHCIRQHLYVRLNEHDLRATDGREMELKIHKSFQHPRFSRQTVDNDIALLLLPRAVRIPTACLPNKKPRYGQLCSVMGWGKTHSSHKYGTPKLNEAKIPVIPSSTCKKSYKHFLITDNMVCAGWSSGKQDTCAGDSGGGLMCSSTDHHRRSARYSVQGITSFGDGCGRRNKYGIYTSVFNYIAWINDIMDHYS